LQDLRPRYFCKAHHCKMNKKQIKPVYPLLKILSKLSDSERQVLLPYLNHGGCEGIYECIHNGLCNSSLPAAERKKLACRLLKDKSKYRFLIRSKDPEARRKKLIQVGGSVGAILSTVLPLLSDFVGEGKKKKAKK
jgi:hypothetical protein